MTYKGYLGSVAFSEKDQVFFGKIEGINGLVNFEGESVKELTEAFHETVYFWIFIIVLLFQIFINYFAFNISSICAGVTTIGFFGKCLVLPVTR